MAIYREDFVDIELTSGNICRSFCNRTIGEGDALANRFGVRAYRNGEAEELGGTCVGLFIRSDGGTVTVEGTVSGNEAYVDLPQACYAVEGQFALAIKVAVEDATATMRIVDGVVSNTTTGTVVDPGTIVPSIEDLIQAIEDALASIPADYSTLWTSLATKFSTSKAYAAGQYVTNEGVLYRFIGSHPAGTWNPGHVTQVSAGQELTDQKNATNELTGNTAIELTPNIYIDLSGSSVTIENGVPKYTGWSSAYSCGFMPCSAGDVFIINGTGGSSTRLWGFVSSTGTIISKAAASLTRSNLQLVAPTNAAWIIVHTNNGKISYKNRNIRDLFSENSFDIIQHLARTNETLYGITYTWSGNLCTVDGTATTYSRKNLWLYTDGFPDGMSAGERCYVDFYSGSGGNVNVAFVFRLSNNTSVYVNTNESKFIDVPGDAIGASIGLLVNPGFEVDELVVGFKIYNIEKAIAAISDDLDEVHEALNKILPYNTLPVFGKFVSGESADVQFTWSADKETCTVSGTSSGWAINSIWSYADGIPSVLMPGESYDLMFTSTQESTVGVRLYYKHIDETVTNTRFTNSTTITIPTDCIGVTIRLEVLEGVTANATVTLKLMTKGMQSVGGVGNHVSRMRSIGSSFLTGAIYPNGVFDHICSFDNSPYGNVAIGLGIEQSNVTHTLVSSTGLLYDAGNGSILSKVMQMDLTGYDYLLTQYNRPDLGWDASVPGFPLGDTSSPAGTSTICGAVKQMLAYMKTNNPNCTLILVGAPPSAISPEWAYDNVFTKVYYNGVSIGEADLMLHRLAVQEHFIFIDWEDLNLSYYYRDLCDNDNVHPRADITCRVMGEYLARQCNYTTSIAKVLKADQG